MSKKTPSQDSFVGGISFARDLGIQNSYSFGRSVDHRGEPGELKITPKSELDSGTIVTDLPMWGARACTRTFAYGNAGAIYQSSTAGSWSKVHTAADSQGNGLGFFTSDNALYYTQNTTFGRLLDACTGSSFTDDFKGSEGGDPTNTKSLVLDGSTQYASRADTASTSITSDLTLETYCKLSALPATGEIQTLISKWDEQSDKRSYKMDITTKSDFFGDGRDGALTISTDTTEDPVDANCTGTSGQNTLTVTNEHASFSSIVSGDKVLIHQTRGTSAGTYQVTSVSSYNAGILTLNDALTFSPAHSATASVANKAQVRLMKQHTDVTINDAITYTSKAWGGLKGGILGFFASGTFTYAGTMTADTKGYIGADVSTMAQQSNGKQGEGTGGAGETASTAKNGSGAGGGQGGSGIAQDWVGGSGGGGGYGTAGADGFSFRGGSPGIGGDLVGDANQALILFGGGGATAGTGNNSSPPGSPTGTGTGGGILLPFAATITQSGSGILTSDGDAGSEGGSGSGAGNGGGAGGSILAKCQTATLGSTTTATQGIGGSSPGWASINGGDGAVGRVALYYSDSFTGTSSPNLTAIQDSELASGDGYLLRLLVSDDGASSETYSWDITDKIDTSSWRRYQISWEDTTSTAIAYVSAVSLGSKTGSMTSIDDNASKFAVGVSFDGSGNAQDLYAGKQDDTRVWNDVRTPSELLTWNNRVLLGTEANEIAYYEWTDDLTDSQVDGLNDLTGTGTPTFSTDVPFSGVTTRGDEDQRNEQTGQTDTLATSISEGATQRQTFVPAKDPQKSIEIDINTIGTGDWTITVHDSLNREVVSLTVVNGDLNTGFYEFIFSSVWRPTIGASYHFHLTSTVADGIVVTGTLNDLETVRFRSHYQFLVSDEYHPIAQHLDFLVMGNERYLAKFEAGDTFDPHKLTFPAGWRVRSLAFWREFIVIGCWKGTNIEDYDDGIIFFWDGIADTYNHFIKVPEGGVNTMFGTQDVLFISAGYVGDVLIYNGGGSAQKFNKIPLAERNKITELAPGSMNMWRGLINYGVNLRTDSSSVHQGVYTIGTTNRALPISVGFDHPTSLGDQQSTNVKVSMVFPSGQDLLAGWQNTNAYGIDRIQVSNDPYSSSVVELLITDMGKISKKQYPLILRADFKPLKSGERIRMKYKADRESAWKIGEWEDTTDAKEVRMRVTERMKELQVACEMETTVSTSPTILGITVEAEMEERARINA